jgi:hypothetical protein
MRGEDGLAVNMSRQHVCVLAGSSRAPPAVWVFWRLIWRTESLDRGLILVCWFSLGSAFQLRLRPALVDTRV